MPNISVGKRALLGRPCLTCQQRKIKVGIHPEKKKIGGRLIIKSATEENRRVSDATKPGLSVMAIQLSRLFM